MSNSFPSDSHDSNEPNKELSPEDEISLLTDVPVTEEHVVLPAVIPEEILRDDMLHRETPRLSQVIEAILFASQKAVSPKELVAHLKSAATLEPLSAAASLAGIKESHVQEALGELQAEVAASGRAYQVRETASGWLLCSASGFAPWLRALYPEAKPTRLSAPALETLAIIAYRQPMTRADMEAVRGVAVDGVMQTLLDRGLVKIAGRAEVPGRALLSATTQYFLDHFGLRHLDELPNAAELRHIPLPQGIVQGSPEQGVQSADAEEQTTTLPILLEPPPLSESLPTEEPVMEVIPEPSEQAEP
jgi:segregation and condensation protein B